MTRLAAADGSTSRRRLPPAALAALALLGVTASWGSTFFLTKGVITRIPVPDFLGVRFVVAALVLVAVRPRAVLALDAPARRSGVLLGLVYGVAQLLQTAGLHTTAASVSGFITGMYVVFTPVLGALVLRQRVAGPVWIAVVLATAGLGLLALRGFAIGSGELLTLASAALYAVHILATGAAMSRTPESQAYALVVVQMIVISLVCCAAAVPDGITLPSRTSDWLALVYMALVSGALALVLQTWAQAHLAPARTAVIMTMEPVWASFFAVLFGGEILGWRLVVGGLLVLTAMYLCELPHGSHAAGDTGRRERPRDPEVADEIGGVTHVGPV